MHFNLISYVRYNTLSKFVFRGARIKVKVVLALFRNNNNNNNNKKTRQKNFAIALVPTFINGF